MKLDQEKSEQDLVTLVQTHLPAKLAEIDAEKNDGVTLTVPSDAQYFNTTDIDEKIINYDLIVKYGIVEGSTNSIYSSSAQTSTYIFLILLTEQNSAPGIRRKKLFRYARAFQEVIQENFDALSYMSSLEIETITPGIWAIDEGLPTYDIAGIYLKASITG